ncbi:MAG: serine/threonine protein phosphatase [Candidatus Bathyarchaeota archaeon]|nr:serine/threonine protein phosphatase [Candidatus Bathyarchaeota archaeon]
MKDSSDLVAEAAQTDSESFLHLVDQVGKLLTAEERSSQIPQIEGRLVRLPSLGEATVIGDIHGDLESLARVLTEVRFVEEASKGKEAYLVFLGDYGDRGQHSPEVFHVVLSLKAMFPNNVVLLQGNHEGPEDLLAHPHDFPYHLQRAFGGDCRVVYRELSRLFRRFHTAVLVEERCVMLHGGVPSKAETLDDVAFAYEKHPAESHLEEILWSDPADGIEGTYPSPRGAGRIFGEDVTEAFLKMLNVPFLIRGHEPAIEGYRINHGGKVLTLFSRKGSPYLNSHGAYLEFDLSRPFDSAWQLEPFIRRI